MKNLIYLKNSINGKTVIVVFLIFISLKSCELKSYRIYEGKVTGFEEVITKYTTYSRGRYGSGYGKMTIPLFEYYKDNDTIQSSEGCIVLLSNFKVGEKIEVLENREFKNKVRIYSFFYFWLRFPEIIILILLCVMVYGCLKLYESKKS